jgi:predicted MFS family arabinose efflux permease
LFFPLMIGPVILSFGWRLTTILSGFVAFSVIMVILKILPVQSCSRALEEDANPVSRHAVSGQQPEVHTSLRSLMAKPGFWIIAPSNFVFSLTNTGYFFYQMVLVESRNWSPEWYRLAFGAYAIVALLASFGIGPIIDRIGARRLFPLYLLPTIIGLTAFGVTGKPSAIVVYLLLNGLSIGAGSVLKSSIYAELFGIRTLGTVRSLFTSIMVPGAALGPILFGYLLDFGFAMDGLESND